MKERESNKRKAKKRTENKNKTHLLPNQHLLKIT